jgi:hypothetical protein
MMCWLLVARNLYMELNLIHFIRKKILGKYVRLEEESRQLYYVSLSLTHSTYPASPSCYLQYKMPIT